MSTAVKPRTSARRLVRRAVSVPLERRAPTPASARRRRRLRTYALIDSAAILLASLAAIAGARATGAEVESLVWLVGFDVLALALLRVRGLYEFRLRPSLVDELVQILAATAIAATVVIAARVLLAPDDQAAGQTVRLWAFVTAYLAAGRAGYSWSERRAWLRGEGMLNTIIIGAGTVGQLVARRLRERPELGLHPVGFLDKEPRVAEEMTVDLPVLGASWDLEAQVEKHEIGHVIVSFSTAPSSVLLGLVRRCRRLGLEISLVPRLFEEVTNRVGVEHLGGLAMLRIQQNDPRGWQFLVKYALDRVAGLTLLLALAPAFGVLALLVRLTSSGPVFYRQPRIGLDGQEFDVLKFRTMREAPETEGEADAEWAGKFARDPAEIVAPAAAVAAPADRRTPIGRMLRRLSLDELPQILNIVRGEMSLIGPRPERTSMVRSFEQHVYRYGDRHRVKSGLTGWAQVHGLRGKTSLTDRIEWDNYYIENWSPWLDLRILFLTIPAVLSGRGAE